MADVNYVRGTEAPVIGAQDGHPNPFVRGLNAVPRILSSKVHVVLLFLLGIYIVVLPLFGLNVSAQSELIGGNYENTTSDIGACIAAGGTVHLIKKGREHRSELAALHAKLD
ncbi:MAG: hypothetical protein M3Y36_05770 [Actinomycetota bacterium]|nr:hypothetical protein [Actinomycetota bacterium]